MQTHALPTPPMLPYSLRWVGAGPGNGLQLCRRSTIWLCSRFVSGRVEVQVLSSALHARIAQWLSRWPVSIPRGFDSCFGL